MDQFIPNFRDRAVQSAVWHLVIYSLTILAVPLGSMFLLKKYFFENFLGYNNQSSIFYSAIVAVILVHFVLVLFVYTAYKEDNYTKDKKQE
uniref:Vacuolar ATPase assembly integral membrane protein vma21 n=1 Tax=Syphacia muris TaxID=451379 RepID=A0A0N5AF20_9BILA